MVQDKQVIVRTIQSHIAAKLEALSADGIITPTGKVPLSIPCVIIKDDDNFNKLI